MCDSRRPANGADSEEAMESVDPRDTFCDWCGWTQPSDWVPHKVQDGNRISWLCDPCFDRHRPEPAGMAS